MGEELLLKNETVALYMGGIYETNLPFTYVKSGWTNTFANNSVQIAQSYQFLYHLDWNWLMPVVRKCMEHGLQETKYYGNVLKYILEDNRRLVFDNIVNFIEWDNHDTRRM